MSSACRVIIVGTGGHASVLWDAALQQPNLDVKGWLERSDYNGPQQMLGLPVYRETAETLTGLLEDGITHFLYGIGSVQSSPGRLAHFERLVAAGLVPLTLVHPRACVAASAVLHVGTFVAAAAVVQPFAEIGRAGIINTGAVVEHHARIGDNVHIGPNATLCGSVTVGEHGFIGAGSVVRQGLVLEKEVTVGAGSVVIWDIPLAQTVVGNPARVVIRESCS